ncbi:MAG TPA: ATP-binding protein [Flavisolibacter sp.]|jgi:signal transduction histidine kinase|nr:ATP-binding protein [Flavisolibacter sp.]
MRISALIMIGFSLILLLFATTTYINFRQSEKVKENAEFLAQSSTFIRNSNRFQRNILNMISGLRGFLLTGEGYFLQAYDTAALENKTILKELSDALPDTSQQHSLLIQIEQLNNLWVNEFASPLRLAKISAEASDRNIAYFNKLYREKIKISNERQINVDLQQKLREFVNIEYERRDIQKAILSSSVQSTRSISFTLTVTSIILAVFIAGFLSYRISRRVLKMVKMADSIAAGNYEVRTSASGNDEVSQLAISLNKMAKVLSTNISELQHKNQELDQFAHIVSHDMKAPLRGIDNVVTWIEEDHEQELSPKLKEYITLIKGRAKRGENLIQGLLAYARVDKELIPAEWVEVQQLISEILENFSDKQNLVVHFRDHLPSIFTERLPLFQVFSNLISNAIKYNDKPKLILEIGCTETETSYLFSVKDNGPGIHENYHKKIYLIFQTLQERDSLESTGVGLAIVKKILDARHESITLQSIPGNGAEFQFTWKKINV